MSAADLAPVALANAALTGDQHREIPLATHSGVSLDFRDCLGGDMKVGAVLASIIPGPQKVTTPSFPDQASQKNLRLLGILQTNSTADR